MHNMGYYCRTPQHGFHALDEHLHNLITGVRHWRQAVETGAFLGGLDGPIDQLDLVHTSTY